MWKGKFSFKHEQGICIDDRIQNYQYPRINTWIIQHMEQSKNYCTVIQLRSSLNGTNMDVKHSYPTWKDCCEHLSYCKVLSVVLHQWRLFWWSALHILEMEDNEEYHGVLLTRKTMELSQHLFAVKFCHLATKKLAVPILQRIILDKSYKVTIFLEKNTEITIFS